MSFNISLLVLPGNIILPVYNSNNETPALQISMAVLKAAPTIISGAL
jgi:hypothetical protein